MSESPESQVRQFLASWEHPDPERLAQFFDNDAIWVDGPQGVRHGAEAIVTELSNQHAISGGITVVIVTLVAEGTTVMAEWRSEWTSGGKKISAPTMAVFEINANGRIVEWREAYDLKYVVDQLEGAAGQVRG